MWSGKVNSHEDPSKSNNCGSKHQRPSKILSWKSINQSINKQINTVISSVQGQVLGNYCHRQHQRPHKKRRKFGDGEKKKMIWGGERVVPPFLVHHLARFCRHVSPFFLPPSPSPLTTEPSPRLKLGKQ